MDINKFQRSRLTFDLSAYNVGRSYWSPINILKHCFLTNIGPIELKFHVKTPFDKLAKMYEKYFGHMTKMTATPIYGKKTFKNLLLKNQTACDVGTWYVALGVWGLPNLFK